MIAIAILFLASVIPPVYLAKKIYAMDRIEPEPRRLIRKLVLCGALACLPAVILEYLGEYVFGITFRNMNVYLIVEVFAGVALVEEICKYFFLKRLTWTSPEFNYRFDGIVYAVFVSLGFAALENIMYLQSYGLSIAFQRAILSIPGHMTFDIYMGHHYSKAKKALLYGRSGESRKELMLALLIAVLLHGFYDYCLMSSHEILYYVFFAFVVLLDIVSIKTVKKEAANDAPFEQWPVY